MEALKAMQIIGNQNDVNCKGCVFISSKYRVTKGFKFHARPQTSAYSCFIFAAPLGFGPSACRRCRSTRFATDFVLYFFSYDLTVFIPFRVCKASSGVISTLVSSRDDCSLLPYAGLPRNLTTSMLLYFLALTFSQVF